MILIGLSGAKRSGKSTVARQLMHDYGFAEISFAAPLYRMMAALLETDVHTLQAGDVKDAPIAWLGRSPRYLMQTLGTEWGRAIVREDIWLIFAERALAGAEARGHQGAVISDVRFVNEAEFVRSRGGEIWHIVRPALAHVRDPHASEAGIPPSLIARRIVNDEGLFALREKIEAIMRALGAPS